MKVLVDGHRYELANQDKPFEAGQQIQFIHKIPQGSNLVLLSDGTTNEEVILMLIDRIMYLDGQLPSKYNEETLGYLKSALASQHNRTADRIQRNVENTHIE